MNSKFLKWAGCLAAMFALAACSSEEMADSTQLPEGKYPITFTATGLEAMAVSRATADGTWTEGDKVAVHLKGDNVDETREYKASATDGNFTLVCNDAKGPFYWKSTSDSYTVTAWTSDGGQYYNSSFGDLILKYVQSNESNYQQSDFLYAHDMLSYTDRNKSLTFYHQTAKVVVHVLSGDDPPNGMPINGVTTRKLSFQTSTWDAPTGNDHYGTSTPDYNTIAYFTPLAFYAGEITLPDNTKTIPLASYKFLIVPQTVKKSDGTLFTITADGYAPFIYTPTADMTWEAGHEYTYYITIKGSNVSATVTTSISWTEGATGTGSTEI